MTVPVCPIHQKPMRPSPKGGGFFCPTKAPDGTWCNHKAAGVPGGNGQASTPAAVPSGASAATLLMVACLDMAARVYQGAGPVADEDAVMAFAFRAFDAARERGAL